MNSIQMYEQISNIEVFLIKRFLIEFSRYIIHIVNIYIYIYYNKLNFKITFDNTYYVY